MRDGNGVAHLPVMEGRYSRAQPSEASPVCAPDYRLTGIQDKRHLVVLAGSHLVRAAGSFEFTARLQIRQRSRSLRVLSAVAVKLPVTGEPLGCEVSLVFDRQRPDRKGWVLRCCCEDYRHDLGVACVESVRSLDSIHSGHTPIEQHELGGE